MARKKTPPVTRQDALQLHEALQLLLRVPATAAFNFAAAMNRKKLAPVVAAVEEARAKAITPKVQAFYDLKQRLVVEHADCTQPPSSDGMVKVKDKALFVRAMKKMESDYAVQRVAMEKFEAKMEGFLLEPVAGLALERVVLAQMPDGVVGRVFDGLLPMVKS